MKTTKKILAVILCLAILTALFVVSYTVSAEEQSYYFTLLNTGFEDTDEKDTAFYTQAKYGYANDDRSVELVKNSGVGNGGSSGALKMGYNNNPTNTNLRPVAALRTPFLYNGTNANDYLKLKSGHKYTLSFCYKAETIRSDVQLWMRTYNSTLASKEIDTNSASIKLAEISKPTDDYVHVDVTFEAQNNEYLIFLLRPTDYENVAGTTIYIDDVTVVEELTCESSTGVQDFEDAATLGYTANTFDVVARINSGTLAISTDQNHTDSGSKSLKMSLTKGATAFDNAPRMILKTEGNSFIAKRGESYRISFWVYSPEEISTFKWHIYSQVIDDFLPNGVQGQLEVEKTDVSLSQGWNQITEEVTIKGANSSEHCFLRLGLTDNNATSAGYGSVTKDFYLDDINIQTVGQKVTTDTITQDFANVLEDEIKGTSVARRANASNPTGGAYSALTSAKGHKSGTATSQFYIPGQTNYTRLYGEYNKDYKMTLSVYSHASSDITVKIRWAGTTTILPSSFDSTNHSVIAEQEIILNSKVWTEITLTANPKDEIFKSNNIYFTLGATIADENDTTTDCTISFDNISINELAKQKTPGAPVVESYTENSVILQELSGGEYNLYNASWQDSNVFENLTPWTSYTFYQRIKEAVNILPSDSTRVEFLLVLHGDLDMDFGINTQDFRLLRQSFLGNQVECNENAKDVNRSGEVDICDLVSLKRMSISTSSDDAVVSIG